MTLFDILVLDAFGALFLCWLGFSRWNRRREERLSRESVCDEVTARMFSAWNNDDSKLNSLQDLTAIAGEVVARSDPEHVGTVILNPHVMEALAPKVDELGGWFPFEHDEVPPVIFETLVRHPVERYEETPWWLSQTGSWPAVGPKELTSR